MNKNFNFSIKFILLILISIISATSCKDNEALAEFDGGKITRKDLRTPLVSFRGEDFIKQANVDMQAQILQNIALTKIAAMEAKKNNLDKDAEFEKRKFLFKEETMVPAYIHHLKEKFKELPFEMINM